MGDDVKQKGTVDVPQVQQTQPKFSLSPQFRERVIIKIINTVKNHCAVRGSTPTPAAAEAIARKFEEKVYASAKNEKDYLAKIAVKMRTLDPGSQRPVNPSIPSSEATSGGPHQLRSASGNVQSAGIRNDQQPVPSKSPAQLQLRQVSNSNSPSSGGLHGPSSAAMTATATPGSSQCTNQNSNLVNLSRMPPNLEKEAPQTTPSGLMSVSQGQDRGLHSQQQRHINQITQGQLSNQHQSPGNIVSTMGKDPVSLSPAQQQQQQQRTVPMQLAYSEQATSRAGGSGPQKQFAPAALPIHKHSPQAEQSDVSSAYRKQPVTKQEYESWQRDIAHQKKSITSQHKSQPSPVKHVANLEQFNTSNNQQNMLPQGRAPETPQQIQHQTRQPNRAHNVVQNQLYDLATGHPQRSMAQSTLRKDDLRHQNVRSHAAPLEPRKDSVVLQQASTRSMSSQEERLHAQGISQQKPEMNIEEKKALGVTSVGQNQPRPGTGTLQLRDVPSDASKRIGSSSAVKSHGDLEVLRENAYQRILAMKKKYLRAVATMDMRINDQIKQYDMQPDDAYKEECLMKLNDSKKVAARIWRLLHLPKEQIMPMHAENMEGWERHIVQCLNKFYSTKNAVSPSLPQDLTPQTHSPQVQQTEEAQIVVSQSEQMTQPLQLVQRSHWVTPQQKPAPLQASNQHQVDVSGDHNENQMAVRADQLVQQRQRVTPQQQPAPLQASNQQQVGVSGDQNENQMAVRADQLVQQRQRVTPQQQPAPLQESKQHQVGMSGDQNENHLADQSDQGNASQTPIERLLKAVSTISPQAFKSSMDDIYSVICMENVMEASAHKSIPKAAIGAPRPALGPLGQDLRAMTGCRMLARYARPRDGVPRIWTPKPQLIPMPPLPEEMDQDTADTASTTEIASKRRKIGPCLDQLLLDEIGKVNKRLIDIIVKIPEDGDEEAFLGMLERSGSETVVECCYIGRSVNLSFLKGFPPSTKPNLIDPLRMLVPADYPKSSPVIAHKLQPDIGDESSEDLSVKARARLDISVRSLNDPFSVSDIARAWELCTRDVMIEYAQKFGGGTFSSNLGGWKKC